MVAGERWNSHFSFPQETRMHLSARCPTSPPNCCSQSCLCAVKELEKKRDREKNRHCRMLLPGISHYMRHLAIVPIATEWDATRVVRGQIETSDSENARAQASQRRPQQQLRMLHFHQIVPCHQFQLRWRMPAQLVHYLVTFGSSSRWQQQECAREAIVLLVPFPETGEWEHRRNGSPLRRASMTQVS